jgi:hypothetical protein
MKDTDIAISLNKQLFEDIKLPRLLICVKRRCYLEVAYEVLSEKVDTAISILSFLQTVVYQ